MKTQRSAQPCARYSRYGFISPHNALLPYRADDGKPVVAGANPKIGFPGICFSDGPRGMNEGTCFPTPSTRANTFNVELDKQIAVLASSTHKVTDPLTLITRVSGRTISKELRAFGGNYFGGVCDNTAPNPKWGVMQESFGEDPLLVGSMGAALTRGPTENVMACIKHFALKSAENKRFQIDIKCDEGKLHDCYHPHFRQCFEKAAGKV
ncbi:hypothetical protein QFC21_006919 [Naganishia friedmannii]|uniref:Uncharacterized protein n=1 Tax=Naganishia friedmannii TaxID=89922 RepID=A0ACC2UZU5_9TREE|nr:hypothetical protein QFC21_006919 [Naganishia friedmannii]